MHINSFPGGAFHFKSLARHFQGLSRGANQMRKNERNARFFFRFDWPSSPPVRPIRGRRSSIRLSIFADDVCAFLFRFFFSLFWVRRFRSFLLFFFIFIYQQTPANPSVSSHFLSSTPSTNNVLFIKGMSFSS